MSNVKKIAVYGGRGALGSACVDHFRAANWWVVNVDVNISDTANHNITLSENDSWLQQEKNAVAQIGEALRGEKLKAVICAAGGWTGGNATNNLSKKADLMCRQSVWSSCIAATIASKFMAPGGLLALTGAKIALGSTPSMIGYGMAKAAVHHLTRSLGVDGSGLPSHSLAVAILPMVLDTEKNRKRMPKADCSSWTPPSFVAKLLETWIEDEEERPPNGCLVELVTKNNITEVFLPSLEEQHNCDLGQ